MQTDDLGWIIGFCQNSESIIESTYFSTEKSSQTVQLRIYGQSQFIKSMSCRYGGQSPRNGVAARRAIQILTTDQAPPLPKFRKNHFGIARAIAIQATGSG